MLATTQDLLPPVHHLKTQYQILTLVTLGYIAPRLRVLKINDEGDQ